MSYLLIRKTILFLYTLGIVIVSLQPITGTSSIPHLDKVQHFIVYAGLALLLFLAFQLNNRRIIGIIGAVLLGIMIEILQPLIAGRERSFLDFLANCVGIIFGTLIYWRYKRPLETLVQSIEDRILPPRP